MSVHRKNPRRDGNEREIVDALEAHGATVVQLSGKGVPDLLVGWRNAVWVLLEVKADKAQLTDHQRIWHATCRGPKPWIVRSPADAVAALHAAVTEAP